jgi:hypothetical protein
VENELNELHELQGIVREGDRLTYKGKKYVRETSTIFCEVTELQMFEGYSQTSPGKTPEMKPSFMGKVRLETDTICVVGTDQSETSKLELFIGLAEPQGEPSPLTEEQRKGLCPLDWRDAIYGQDAITTISFTPHDREIGRPESLRLDIHAPRAMLDALQSAFEAGRLHGVYLGLMCGLWTMEERSVSPGSMSMTILSIRQILMGERSPDWWPPACSTKWYLFPERVSDSGDIVFEKAHGWLSHFSINSAPLRLGIEAKGPPDVRAAATLDSISLTLDSISRTLDSISRTLDSIPRTLARTLDNIIWRPILWVSVTLAVLFLIRTCTR